MSRDGSLSRREWVLGAAAGLVGTAATTAGSAHGTPLEAPQPAAPVSPPHDGDATADVRTLIAPLTEGSALGPWHLESVRPLHEGAAGLVLRDQAGNLFQLDLCARDDSPAALRAPGRSQQFDVYLANGGAGDTASFEHHGLAAMAVADVLRHNEAVVGSAGFKTLRDRLATSFDRVKRHA